MSAKHGTDYRVTRSFDMPATPSTWDAELRLNGQIAAVASGTVRVV